MENNTKTLIMGFTAFIAILLILCGLSFVWCMNKRITELECNKNIENIATLIQKDSFLMAKLSITDSAKGLHLAYQDSITKIFNEHNLEKQYVTTLIENQTAWYTYISGFAVSAIGLFSLIFGYLGVKNEVEGVTKSMDIITNDNTTLAKNSKDELEKKKGELEKSVNDKIEIMNAYNTTFVKNSKDELEKVKKELETSVNDKIDKMTAHNTALALNSKVELEKVKEEHESLQKQFREVGETKIVLYAALGDLTEQKTAAIVHYQDALKVCKQLGVDEQSSAIEAILNRIDSCNPIDYREDKSLQTLLIEIMRQTQKPELSATILALLLKFNV